MALCDRSAYELSGMVHRREVTASEILDSALERINLVDGRPGQHRSQ